MNKKSLQYENLNIKTRNIKTYNQNNFVKLFEKKLSFF